MPQKIIAQYPHLPHVILHPGEIFIAKKPALISTLLGSCVSVCLHCPAQNIGAMCHGILPSQGANKNPKDLFRFVEDSVAHMVYELTDKTGNCATSGLVAKIFGGANVLKSHKGENQSDIGGQNILAARQALKKNNIGIAVERIGGNHGCKLVFLPHTGEVYRKPLG